MDLPPPYTFQEYVDARYNMKTLCSSDMILFIKRMASDKTFIEPIVLEYEKWRQEKRNNVILLGKSDYYDSPTKMNIF